MTDDARDRARQLAHDSTVDVVRELVTLAKARRPARNAQARITAARLLLDVAGLTGTAAQLDSLERYLQQLEPLMSAGAYAEMIRASATLRGMAAEGDAANARGAGERPEG